MKPDPIEQIEADAAAWDARLRAPGAADADRFAYQAWRDADPLHGETFDRLQAIYAALGGAIVRPELRALRDEGRARVRRTRLRAWQVGGLAACAAAVAIAVALPRLSAPAPDPVLSADSATAVPPPPRGAKVYRTALNERSTVTLEDGSIVTLDSASTLYTRFEPGRRAITLADGQALFKVAKDPARAFVVRAGGRTVTALGTVFSVRLDRGRARVTLIEGKVAVRGVAGPAVASNILTPKQQLTERAPDQAPVVRTVDVEKAVSWTEGRVFFENERLADAAREMNRYSATKLVVADAAVGDLHINGMFRAGNQTGFAGAMQSSFPIEVRADGAGQIVLESRPQGPAARR